MSLEDMWRDLIAKASIVSEGGTSKIDSGRIRKSKPGGNAPTMQGKSLLDRMRDRWAGCESDRDRELAIAWAKGQLRNLHREAPEMTAKQQHYWVVEQSQGRHYQDVADEHGLDPKVVWKMRKDAGMDPRRGRPKG